MSLQFASTTEIGFNLEQQRELKIKTTVQGKKKQVIRCPQLLLDFPRVYTYLSIRDHLRCQLSHVLRHLVRQPESWHSTIHLNLSPNPRSFYFPFSSSSSSSSSSPSSRGRKKEDSFVQTPSPPDMMMWSLATTLIVSPHNKATLLPGRVISRPKTLPTEFLPILTLTMPRIERLEVDGFDIYDLGQLSQLSHLTAFRYTNHLRATGDFLATVSTLTELNLGTIGSGVLRSIVECKSPLQRCSFMLTSAPEPDQIMSLAKLTRLERLSVKAEHGVLRLSIKDVEDLIASLPVLVDFELHLADDRIGRLIELEWDTQKKKSLSRGITTLTLGNFLGLDYWRQLPFLLHLCILSPRFSTMSAMHWDSPTLESLSLCSWNFVQSNTDVEDDVLRGVMRTLARSQLPRLHTLQFKNCVFGERQRFPNPMNLSKSGPGLRLPSLTRLSFAGCHGWTSENMPRLPALSTVTALDLSNINMREGMLSAPLQDRFPALTELHLPCLPLMHQSDTGHGETGEEDEKTGEEEEEKTEVKVEEKKVEVEGKSPDSSDDDEDDSKAADLNMEKEKMETRKKTHEENKRHELLSSVKEATSVVVIHVNRAHLDDDLRQSIRIGMIGRKGIMDDQPFDVCGDETKRDEVKRHEEIPTTNVPAVFTVVAHRSTAPSKRSTASKLLDLADSMEKRAMDILAAELDNITRLPSVIAHSTSSSSFSSSSSSLSSSSFFSDELGYVLPTSRPTLTSSVSLPLDLSTVTRPLLEASASSTTLFEYPSINSTFTFASSPVFTLGASSSFSSSSSSPAFSGGGSHRGPTLFRNRSAGEMSSTPIPMWSFTPIVSPCVSSVVSSSTPVLPGELLPSR